MNKPPFRTLILLALLALAPSSPAQFLRDAMPPADAATVAELLPGATLLEGGIRFIERTPGTGPQIAKGDTVTALYVGRLLDGTVFNQKRSRFHSFTFEVGATPRQIIRGWEQTMPLMQNGGTYTLAIPAELAYRSKGRPGQVPPNATVIFDIEIIAHTPSS